MSTAVIANLSAPNPELQPPTWLEAAPNQSTTNLARLALAGAENKSALGAYRIHGAAAVIPSLAGAAFDAFVEEIARHGQRDAVVLDGDTIIEGVDVVRAVGVLKERGVAIDLQTVEWQPRPSQTVPEFLAYKLLRGPRFTEAQRAQIAADLLPLIEQERAAAQEAARIKPGEQRNPHGTNKRTAGEVGGRDSHPASEAKALNRAKRERSTVGQIASRAAVTEYAARQAVTIQRHAAPEIIAAVKAGTLTPKAALATIAPPPKKPKPVTKAARPIDHPFKPETALERDLVNAWVHLVDNEIAIDERAEARRVMRAILDAEEAAATEISRTPGSDSIQAPKSGPRKRGSK